MNSFQTIIFYAPLIVILFWTLTIGASIKKNENHFKTPFLLFLIDAFAAIVVGGFFHTGEYQIYRICYIPGAFFALAMFPFFHLFIINLTQEGGLTRSDYIKHLAFPILCMVISAYMLLIVGDLESRKLFVENILAQHEEATGYLRIVFLMDKSLRMSFILWAIAYYVFTERRIKKHKNAVLDYFSNTEDTGINWFNGFRIIFAMILLAAIIYYSVDRAITIKYIYIPSISRMLLAIFFWSTGYYISKQKLIYTETEEEQKIDTKDITDEIMCDLALSLDKLMVDDKRFTDSDLTLPKLAVELGTNRTYLSRLFNTHLKTNFNTYINDKRVLYAKELLNSDQCQINTIYDECGFKSSSNFYRIFSESTHTTPMKYHKEMMT